VQGQGQGPPGTPGFPNGAGDRPNRWTITTLRGAGVHIGHGHGQQTEGHGWLTPEMQAEVRRRGLTTCPEDLVLAPDGTCVFPGSPASGAHAAGMAVMGRYGAAIIPGGKTITRRVCIPGMQLGNDGLCYNKGQITNKERKWPAGRRPLLTGGDMRAISIAARAGARLERTSKRLQKIGLMKKPPPRRKMITSGPTDHHHHEG